MGIKSGKKKKKKSCLSPDHVKRTGGEIEAGDRVKFSTSVLTHF